MSYSTFAAGTACPDCGRAVQASSLSCPGCGWLRHSAQLEDLARRAAEAEQAGELAAARGFWEHAIKLLPESTVQFRSVQARIDALTAKMGDAGAKNSGWKKRRGAAPRFYYC